LSFHPTINAVYWVENTHIRKEFILVLQDSLNRSVPFESFFFKLYGNFVYNHLLCETLSGESIEEALCREVKEESNVDIDINKVVYVASQPWPFGGQIMIGCFAQATSTQIELTTELRELENVQWFGVSEVTEALKRSQATTSSKQLRIPPFTAIAHRLIVHWLNQKSLHLNKISNESGVCDTILSSKNK